MDESEIKGFLEKKRQKISRLITYSLFALVIFLPFSSWLVSITGVLWISLLRDIFVVVIFGLTVIDWVNSKYDLKKLIVPGLFILWGLMSFFWRDVSAGQWARGFRYYFMPIILYCSLLPVNLSEGQKKRIFKAVLVMGVLIVGLAFLELLGVKLPLTSKYSGVGALVLVHKVGGLQIVRLQSILAGPNALGFYMLALTAYSVGALKEVTKKYWIWSAIFLVFLILSFSRSAFLGAVIILLVLASEKLIGKFGRAKARLMILFGITLVVLAGILLYNNPKVKDYVAHGGSNAERVQQYQRIWEEKSDIGLLGRGTGAAGLDTQYQIDGANGQNHWTENTYLDIFEQLGLVGMFLFIGSLVSALILSWKQRNTLVGKSAFLGLLAFSAAGLFISMYTGQVGMYLIFIICGMTGVGYEKRKEKSK